MKRLVVAVGGGAVRWEAATRSALDGESVRLLPEYVGVCGTDLDIIARFRADRPLVIGHEAVVRVARPHPRIAHPVRPGSLFLINPVDPGDQDRIVGHSVEGMLQSAVDVSTGDLRDDLLVPLVDGLDPRLAVLSEPLGAALYGLALLTRPTPPRRLLVMGGGPIGLLIAMTARLRGVPEVAVIDRSRQRAEYAADSGLLDPTAVFVRGPGTRDTGLRACRDFAPDAIALCVGRENRLSGLGDAIRIAPPGARICLTTGFLDGETLADLPGVPLNRIRRRNVCGEPEAGRTVAVTTADGRPLHLTGHRGTSRRQLTDAMGLLLNHPAVYSRVITDVVGFDSAPAALHSVLRERAEPDSAPYRKLVIAIGPR